MLLNNNNKWGTVFFPFFVSHNAQKSTILVIGLNCQAKVTRDFVIPCIDGTPVDCAQDLLLRRGPLATTSSQSFVETLKLKRKVFVSSKVQCTFTM